MTGPENGDAPKPPPPDDLTLKQAPGERTLQEASSDPKPPPPADFSVAQFGPSHDNPAEKTTLYSEKPLDPSSLRGRETRSLAVDAAEAAKDPKNILNQYVLVKLIGKGGMGTVWKAFDRTLQRWVAIKFLIAEGNEEGVLRFQREARLSASLHHPNIAPVYEVGQARGQHFLAMEYIDGHSLATAELSMTEVADIFGKVCQGVEAAHRKGIVHRDLKPQNIMLTQEKWPYVMDFGLAKAFDKESSISVSGAIMGTPAYMPPEQAQGKQDLIDARTDVYSLGATIYAVLTKKPPFVADTAMDVLMKVCTEDPPAPRALNPGIPVDLETIVLKAMSKRREDRYPSAAAMAEDLVRFVKNEEIQATRPSSLKVAMRKVRRNPLIVALSVSLILLGSVVVWVVTRPKPPVNPGAGGPSPSPSVDPKEAARVKRLEELRRRWGQMREALDYKVWAPGTGPAAADARGVGADLVAAVTREDDSERFVDWWTKQWDKADRELDFLRSNKPMWLDQRAKIEKVRDWTVFAGEATAGIERLRTMAAAIPRLRAETESMLAWKGTFTLRVLIAPYAKIAQVRKDGREVAIGETFTPAVLKDLEIGDYELRLEHPELGTAPVSIAAGDLKNGKTYLLSGPVKEARLVESP